MKRRKAVYLALTLIMILVGYCAYAFRPFYLTPELAYDADVPLEARPVIDTWYNDSKYKRPPSIKSANYIYILMHPHAERPTVPVKYNTISWEGRLISLEFYWKPWEGAVHFSRVSGKWEYDGVVEYPKE
ncbi:MAG: hypothetical protein H7A51_13430 [Akkermansiaceae bacterium]|nr:hypothetical protein [Akkermansiaceae bacterium]